MTSNATKGDPDGVVLQGYHKKLKTMKKKYFVLCAENTTTSARLEYYDSEKKFKSRSNPKRTIILKNCFNIFRRLDTKHKYVISLSMKNESFCMVMDSEEELNKWLRSLLALQRGENTESDPPKPTFEHVWPVVVRPKGLAEERGILGSYYVCLTMKSLTLIPIGHDRDKRVRVDFLLTTIRRCGNSQCYFYMEVGRYSAFGAGELWMETTDPLIAQNMHTMIINAMTNSVKNRDDNSGQMRRRSSSETSKPISVAQMRQTASSNRPLNSSSPLSGSTMGRERCDSLPSRNRTASDSSNHSMMNPTSSMPPPRTIPALSNRPHSMYNNRHSHSPPVNALSPSTGCSESEGSSLSIDETDSFGHSLTPDESGNFVSRYYNSRSGGVIPEENCDDFWYTDNNKRNSNERIAGNLLDKLNNHHHGILSLPISANQNSSVPRGRGSPIASHIGSAETQQGQTYMDMYSPYSPCGSSPCDQTGSGYMPCSPGVEFPRGLYCTAESSGGHSRASSLAEETTTDGYVPMCPQSSSAQDYVDMEQGSTKQQNLSGFSSAASSCSITSGTPSTDVRFAEYSLDKVQSRFTPDDEDIQSGNERPLRTYSVGSRLEHNKRKLRVDMLNAEQSMSRVRAFSVGSRAKVPRCGDNMYRGGYTPNLVMSHTNNNYNVEMNASSIVGNAVGKSKKSSSAPILVHKSQSSVDRMSDLMEIDFSKNSEHNDGSCSSSVAATPSPGRISSFPVQVPSVSNNRIAGSSGYFGGGTNGSPKIIDFLGTGSSSSMISAGYVEMKPTSSSERASSITSIKSAVDTGYLEMKPVGLSKSPSLSSSPIKSFSSSQSQKSINQQNKSSSSLTSSSPYVISPKTKTINNSSNCDYMNISPSSTPNSLISRATFTNNNNNNNDNTNCHNPSLNPLSSSSISNEKLYQMEVDDFPVVSSSTISSNTPEGYMEMSFDNGKTKSLSLSSASANNDSLLLNNEAKHSLAGRSISSPIDIKSKDSKKGFELTLSEAFAKSHHRTDSVDLNNILATPSCSSQAIIFPFSPGSPHKVPFTQNDFAHRKCLIDGTSGTLTISEDSSSSSKDEKCNEDEKPLNTTTTAAAKETKILNTDILQRLNSSDHHHIICSDNVEALSNDYADMSLDSSSSSTALSFKKTNNSEKISSKANAITTNNLDYVNYAPQGSGTASSSSFASTLKSNVSKFCTNTDLAGDYAIMKPVATDHKIATQSSMTNKKQLPIASFRNFDTDRAKTFEGFKSIASSSDEMFLRSESGGKSKKTNSPKLSMITSSSSSSNSNKMTAVTTTLISSSSSDFNKSRNDDCSGYELLQMRSDSSLPTVKRNISRPNSVNSDKISPLKAHCRPNSVNSECIPPSISTSSSTSTLCGGGSSSSSSTLCGSKSQSPLTNSRPQSFSDTTITTALPALSSSRPDSVSSLAEQNVIITSRPPSVSSERELHYASLDLPPASNSIATTTNSSYSLQNQDSDGNSTNMNCIVAKGNSSTSGESSTSPSPIISSSNQQQPTFTYAQIDFNKSESLKIAMNAAAAAASTSTSNNQ